MQSFKQRSEQLIRNLEASAKRSNKARSKCKESRKKLRSRLRRLTEDGPQSEGFGHSRALSIVHPLRRRVSNLITKNLLPPRWALIKLSVPVARATIARPSRC